MGNAVAVVLRPWYKVIVLGAVFSTAYGVSHLWNVVTLSGAKSGSGKALVLPSANPGSWYAKVAGPKQGSNEDAAAQDLNEFFRTHKWGIYKQVSANEQRWVALLATFIDQHPGTHAAVDAAIEASVSYHGMKDDNDALAMLESFAGKYYGTPDYAKIVAREADILGNQGRLDDALTVIKRAEGKFKGHKEDGTLRRSKAWIHALQGNIKEAKRLAQEVANDSTAGATNNWRARISMVRMEVRRVKGAAFYDDNGRKTSLNMKDANALFEQVHQQYADEVASIKTAHQASTSPTLQATNQLDSDAASQAVYDYGQWLLQYQRYSEALEQFEYLAQAGNGPDFRNGGQICAGIALYGLGRFDECANTEQAALADPNLVMPLADKATLYMQTAFHQLAPDQPAPQAEIDQQEIAGVFHQEVAR